jgi:hypothetical protein
MVVIISYELSQLTQAKFASILFQGQQSMAKS